MSRQIQCWFVVPAAGTGERMQLGYAKQFYEWQGHTILWHTLRALMGAHHISGGVVALNHECATDEYQFDKPLWICQGGQTRSRSVFQGLLQLEMIGAQAEDWVLVHDAARPGIQPIEIDHMITQLYEDTVGGIMAIPVTDTVKCVDAKDRIVKTIPREQIWLAQTPQMFRLHALKNALYHCFMQNIVATDEASAMEAQGFCPKVVAGSRRNIKITFPEDLEYLDQLF